MSSRSRLSEADKILIKKLRNEERIPYAAIAANFGVSSATINRICNPDLAARQAEANRQYRARNKAKDLENQRKKYRNYRIRFHRDNDKEVIEHLDKQENVLDYVRQLILKEIKDTNE